MVSMIKCLTVATVIALTTASGAFAYEQGGVKVSGSPSQYSQTNAAGGIQSNVSGWDRFKGFVGGAISAVTGVDPFSVSDAVDIVAENSESLAETRDNAEEYFEAYPDAPGRDRYTLEGEDLEDKPAPGVYKWFWSHFE